MPRLLRASITRALLTLGTAASLQAQRAPVIETIVPLDSAGRFTVVTPTIVARLGLREPEWPVAGPFREARLYRSDSARYVLVVQRVDATVARFALDEPAVDALRRAVNTAMRAQGANSQRLVGSGTGFEVSQPAGNAFVRNQTFLGIVAYGPATAALLSDAGGAGAGAGYFLAAGTSFFVAANLVRNRTVTRAQASRAAHGGTRGALTGVAIAAIADADGGPAWGGPILVGAVAGSIVGYRQARGLSDGEAASAGFFSDLGALTTLGITGSTGVFKGREERIENVSGQPEFGTYTRTDNSLRAGGRVAVGATIGAQVIGYALGPRYARRAAYNVTAGDINVAFASALLGGMITSSVVPKGADARALFGSATAGVLLGALSADRGLVRAADRTSADGTLAQLGALAGALMGGGVAALAEFESQGALALAGLGGTLGLLAADNIIRPAKDAGPLRGVMQSSARAIDGRVLVSLGPVSSVRISF
jgi:hypothetical protein